MKCITLITLVLGTVLAAAPAAHAVVVSDGSDGTRTEAPVQTTNMSPAEYRALAIRGEALNQRYGNAVTRLTPQEFRSLSETVAPDELVGAAARGEALNDRYGSSVTIRPDILGGDGGESTTPVSSPTGDSIGWNAAIAGAALIAAMLLALGFAAANRRRHQLSF